MIRPPSFTSRGKSGKPARAVLWLLLVGIPSSKIYHGELAVIGRDAKRLVILKGDFESGEEKGGGGGGQLKEEIARKYSAYFQSILHHNNGYFLTVSAILTTSCDPHIDGRPSSIDCCSLAAASPCRCC